jgi:hypothetical protein
MGESLMRNKVLYSLKNFSHKKLEGYLPRNWWVVNPVRKRRLEWEGLSRGYIFCGSQKDGIRV